MNVSREPHTPPPITISLTDLEADMLVSIANWAERDGADSRLADFARRFRELVIPAVNREVRNRQAMALWQTTT